MVAMDVDARFRMLSARDQQRLDGLLKELDEAAALEVGFPVAFDVDYRGLAPFLGYNLNNCGDPFRPCSYRLNTHDFELEVLAF